MAGADGVGWADIDKFPVGDHHRLPGGRTLRKHDLLGQQQQGGGGQGVLHGAVTGRPGERWNTWLKMTAATVPMARPLPRMICRVWGNWP